MSKRKASYDSLVELHCNSHLSQRALVAVLKHVRDNGLPDAFSRRTQGRAHAELCNTDTPYGKISRELEIPLSTGIFKLLVGDPMPLFYETVKRCQPFRMVLREKLAASPCSLACPWQLVVYSDGISPQSPLTKGYDKRMVQACYWSFAEFGEYLVNECMWFCSAAIATVRVNKLSGNMSHVYNILFSELFFRHDRNWSRHGLTVDLSDDQSNSELVTLIVQHRISIADEKEQTSILMSKGHAGTKPCPLCRNIVDHRTGYADFDASGTLEPITSLRKARWVPHTDNSVRQVLSRLQTAQEQWERNEISKAAMESLGQRLGWNYNANNVILNAGFTYNPISTLCYDWPHIWLVDGILQREIESLLLHRPKRFGATELHDELNTWKWPSSVPTGAAVFETGSFQASASESLSCVPVLARYIQCVVKDAQPQLHAEVEGCLLCCSTIELHQACAYGKASPDALEPSVMEFMKARQDAYGMDNWVFKHHQAMHVPRMAKKNKRLFGSLVNERKHRLIKRFARDHQISKAYERHLMQQLIAQHFHDLEHMPLKALGLIDPRTASKQLRDTLQHMRPNVNMVVASTSASDGLATFNRGDIVLLGHRHGFAAAEIWFHVDCDAGTVDATGVLSLVDIYPFQRTGADGRWGQYELVCGTPTLIPTVDIRCSAIYKKSDRTVSALWPVYYKDEYKATR